MKERIKFLIMDVDGTLTDGKINIAANGEVFKAFNVKDGCGIKDILPVYGIRPVIITARESEAVAIRCKELHITDYYQGCSSKGEMITQVIEKYNNIEGTNLDYSNCAYIGDDILDLQCMVPIKAAHGIVGCPNDAVAKVKEISDYVCEKKGGDGAVREFIEWLIL